jgi:hypothetical protein
VWVVHQVLFASKLTVILMVSTGGKLTCHVVPGTPGGELKCNQSPDQPNTITLSDPRIDLKYPGKILFAFRAQCFHFNAVGEYVGMEVDAGAVRPKLRAEENNPSHE